MNKLTLLIAGLLLVSAIVIGELLSTYDGMWDMELISFLRGLLFGIAVTLIVKESSGYFKERAAKTSNN